MAATSSVRCSGVAVRSTSRNILFGKSHLEISQEIPQELVETCSSGDASFNRSSDVISFLSVSDGGAEGPRACNEKARRAKGTQRSLHAREQQLQQVS